MRALRETVLRHNIFDWGSRSSTTALGLHLITPRPNPQGHRELTDQA